MIGKTLQNILNEKGINVNELSNMINVSNQTLYSIIKRDNMKIDFEILLKICDALNVNVERFYAEYYHANTNQILLTNHEKLVIDAYRQKSEMQPAVDKLLGVSDDEMVAVPVAVRSESNRPVEIMYIPKEKLELLENTKSVEDEVDL